MAGSFELGNLFWKITADTSQFNKNYKQAEKDIDGLKDKAKSATAELGRSLVPLVALGGAAVKFASDLSESINAVNVVFEDSAGIIKDWGDNAAEQAGLSRAEFNSSATRIGALLQKTGNDLDTVAEDTITLTKRSADLASVFNTDLSVALTAVQAGLRGETEPLRQFAINLSAAEVEAKALELGLAGTKAELTEAAKVQARYTLILEQSARVQGDFENTNEGAANSLRVIQANIKDLAAEVGTNLLPAVEGGLKVIRDLIKGFSDLPGPLQAATGLLVGFVTVVPKVVAAFGAVKAAVLGLNLAVAGPIGLVVAIGTLIGVVAVFLGQQSEAAKAFSDLAEATGVAEPAIAAISRRYDTLRQSNKGLSEIIRDLSNEFDLESTTIEKLIANTDILSIKGRTAEQQSKLLGDQLVLLTKGGLSYNEALERLSNQYDRTGERIEYIIETGEKFRNESRETAVTIGALSQARAIEAARLEEVRKAQENARLEAERLAQQAIESAQAEAIRLEGLERAASITEILDELNKQLENTVKLGAAFGEEYDVVNEQINLIKSAITSLIEIGLDPASQEVQALIDKLAELAEQNIETGDSFDLSAQKAAAYAEGIRAARTRTVSFTPEVAKMTGEIDLTQNVLQGINKGLSEFAFQLATGELSAESFGASFLGITADILDALAAQLIAQAAAQSLLLLGPIGIPAALAAAAAASVAAGLIRGGASNLSAPASAPTPSPPTAETSPLVQEDGQVSSEPIIVNIQLDEDGQETLTGYTTNTVNQAISDGKIRT